ncbi:MAG: hypothetical protein PHE48_00115 [Candidatus Daviesbacteria bacterium]|nr:hypothetical protein [Candidatus Daviesbacteria bacterium]
MNRNTSIVIVILVLVVIAGYLVWLRSKTTSIVSPQVNQQEEVTPVPTPSTVASPSATPKAEEATGSTKAKSATSSSTGR